MFLSKKVLQMPLEMKRHTILPLKALTDSIEHAIRHGLGSTFMQRYIVLKSAILLHKRAKGDVM